MSGVASRGTFFYAVLLAGFLWIAAGAGVANAQEEAGNEAAIYPLPGEEVFPEGVAYQPETGDFFVSSTTDGTIYRSNVARPGQEAEIFLPPGGDGRSTAVGLAVDSGRLFVAGGPTGQGFVYDAGSGALIDSFSNGKDMTFVNDVTVAPDGSAYFTDSMSPALYRLFPTADGGYGFETFLEFEGTPVQYEEGFNLNGIAATPDGRYLISVQSNTGKLFRIDLSTREVTEIDTGGADFTNGDGILLEGQTLYVVRNQQELIVPVSLSADYASGTVGEPFTNSSFNYPTTIAGYDGRLLAVNSQFGARESGGQPELPFTVSGIPIPASAAPATAGTAPGTTVPETGGMNPAVLLVPVGLLAGLALSVAGYARHRRQA